MRTCTRCGASAYVDADPYCEHAYHEPPVPSVVTFDGAPIPWVDFAPPAPPPERLWNAIGIVDDQAVHARHPTREGAIALWQERWTWGPAIAALFGWLCERPTSEPRASAEVRGAQLASGEFLQISTGTFWPQGACGHLTYDHLTRAIEVALAQAPVGRIDVERGGARQTIAVAGSFAASPGDKLMTPDISRAPSAASRSMSVQ